MLGLLVFAVLLTIAVLFSGLARRSVLSAAVLFLVGGFLSGTGVLGFIRLEPTSPVVSRLTELALFTVLFTEGMLVDLGTLRKAWHLPGRALLFGLPLTMLVTAILARYLAGLSWTGSFLLGAALSPTDPVLAQAIVGREEVPDRLRYLLNVESGLNDGLSLPVVVILIQAAGMGPLHITTVLVQMLAGAAIGIAVPWLIARLQRWTIFEVVEVYEDLLALAIGLVVLACATLVHANELLAAFVAGITVGTMAPETRDNFTKLGEVLTEVLKLAAVLLFGALISPRFLGEIGWRGYLFAVVALVLARPVALGVSLVGTRLTHRERIVAAWFGPRGFASVFYALLIVKSQIPRPDADEYYHLAAIVIAFSIIAHSSTDVLVARWFATEATARDG